MKISLPRQLAATVVGAASVAAPAAAQTPTATVNTVQDSVLVSGLPFGSATLTVTRPDALTGAPVTIGQYTGFAFAGVPFSVNMTMPTPLNPGGDCWQKAALSSALTPDIRPGDSVAVTGAAPIIVGADAESGDGAGGPIAGCAQLAPYAHNGATAVSADGADVVISGDAQPLATGVAVSLDDGHGRTAPLDATLVADGTWRAPVPTSGLAALADGTVQVDPLFAVPDAGSGAAAHVWGAPLRFEKRSITGGVSVTQPGAPAVAAPLPAAPVRRARPSGLRAPARIRLAHARRRGLRVSFVVPDGARVVRLRLARRGTVVASKLARAGKAGARMGLRVRVGSRVRRGRYTLNVRAGASRAALGPAGSLPVVIR